MYVWKTEYTCTLQALIIRVKARKDVYIHFLQATHIYNTQLIAKIITIQTVNFNMIFESIKPV